MSQFEPVNGASTSINLGTRDLSRKRRLYQEARRGIHVPLIYSWAEYGPVDEAILVYGNTIPLTFGDETLNGRSKYASHVTPYLLNFLSNANSVLFERILPRDHGPKATLRIWMDINDTEVDEYEREIDGSFKRDINDDIVKTGAKIPGLEIKFTTEVIDLDLVANAPKFGKGTIKTGSMTNHLGTPSKKMPFMDIMAPHFGELGNNRGIRLWAPTYQDINPLKERLLDEDNVYPFRMACISRLDNMSSSKRLNTLFGESYDDFCLKPNMVDTAYNRDRYIQDTLIKQYADLSPIDGNPVRYGPIGNVKVYQDNVDLVLKRILELEKDRAYPENDLQGRSLTDETREDWYRVNLLGLQNPSGAPYQCARFDTTSTDGVRFTENTDLYMEGAFDGTMTDQELAKVVESKLDDWGDPDSIYQDIIYYPCSYFWDSGFPLSTKYKMGKFIAHRKNTAVAIATYVAGEQPLTTSEESSRHIAIVERVRAFAESDYFATPTMRACVVSRSGVPVASTFRGRLPCTLELANMISRMAGGTSFISTYLFDRPPYNIFELLGDVKSLWAPMRVRNRDWMNGMMWPERINSRQIYFPASKTVYKDDTSVLNSVINTLIICECETVGILCQKYFSGSLYSKFILKAKVEEWIRERLENKFAGLCRIEPECYFTDADNHRGYSWTLNINVHLPMMRTVQTLYITAYDIDDLPDDSQAFVS